MEEEAAICFLGDGGSIFGTLTSIGDLADVEDSEVLLRFFGFSTISLVMAPSLITGFKVL